MRTIIHTFDDLGVRINYRKSQLHPVQQLQALGSLWTPQALLISQLKRQLMKLILDRALLKNPVYLSREELQAQLGFLCYIWPFTYLPYSALRPWFKAIYNKTPILLSYLRFIRRWMTIYLRPIYWHGCRRHPQPNDMIAYTDATKDMVTAVIYVQGKIFLWQKKVCMYSIHMAELIPSLVVISFAHRQCTAVHLPVDNSVVLHWLRSPICRTLPTVVLCYMYSILSGCYYSLRYIASEDNPADILTRACLKTPAGTSLQFYRPPCTLIA